MYYNIRLGMLQSGITVEDIAQLLKVHRNTMSKKLNGKAKLTADELQAIRDRFFPNSTLDKLAERVRDNA